MSTGLRAAAAIGPGAPFHSTNIQLPSPLTLPRISLQMQISFKTLIS